MSFVLYISILPHFPITAILFSIAEYIAFNVVGHCIAKVSFLNTSNFGKIWIERSLQREPVLSCHFFFLLQSFPGWT